MMWNPQVVAGIGAVADPTQLHKDMHGYLAGGCLTCPKAEGYLVVIKTADWCGRSVACPAA